MSKNIWLINTFSLFEKDSYTLMTEIGIFLKIYNTKKYFSDEIACVCPQLGTEDLFIQLDLV